MKNKFMKQSIAMLLTVALLFAMIDLSVFAVGKEGMVEKEEACLHVEKDGDKLNAVTPILMGNGASATFDVMISPTESDIIESPTAPDIIESPTAPDIIESPTAPDIISQDVVVDETTGYISKITAGTTVEAFLRMIDGDVNVKILDTKNTIVENNDYIGTGMMVKVMNGDVEIKSYTIVVTGDTNGDGKISITDMIAVKAHLLKKELLSGASEKAADVAGTIGGGDGKVSITDFIKVKAHLLKKETIIGVAVR